MVRYHILILSLLLSTFIPHFNTQTSLTTLLNDSEASVQRLADDLILSFRGRCTAKCECSYHMCSNRFFDRLTCDARYTKNECAGYECQGSLISRSDRSGFTLANRFSQVSINSNLVRRSICYTNDLQNTFEQNANNEDILSQYVGVTDGTFRSYPGLAFCDAYDPRFRPWYAAASTGAKNLLILYENSNQMNLSNKDQVAKEFLNRLLDTVNNVDQVAFISFNTSTTNVNQYFVQGSATEKARIKAFYDGLTGLGNADVQNAFESAYSYIRSSKTNGNLLDADIFIVSLTTGELSAGEGDVNTILNRISNLNGDNSSGFTVNARNFPVLVGNRVDDSWFVSLACQGRGIYNRITNSDSTAVAINDYLQVLVYNNNNSNIVWTEPYNDATGFGQIATAARAVYDTNVTPNRLIGVVAIDLKVTKLLQFGSLESITNTLRTRSRNSVTRITWNNCELDVMRSTERKCLSEANRQAQCSGTIVINPNPDDCSGVVEQVFCDKDAGFTVLNSISIDQRCCTKCRIINEEAVIASVVVAGFLLIIIVVLVIVIAGKSKRIRELEQGGKPYSQTVVTENKA